MISWRIFSFVEFEIFVGGLRSKKEKDANARFNVPIPSKSLRNKHVIINHTSFQLFILKLCYLYLTLIQKEKVILAIDFGTSNNQVYALYGIFFEEGKVGLKIKTLHGS